MEEGNYRGRIKRLEKWKEIQTVVVQKLSKLVVICMLDVARERIFRKVEFPDRIPCSMYWWVDIVMLFLVYVLDYDSQYVLEKKYKVPHATAGRVITWMIKKLKLINTIFTKCLTYEQRLKVTEDYISKVCQNHRFDRWYSSTLEHDSVKQLHDWSYKLKSFGYNVLFGGLVNGYFFFCGKPFPASTNDITLLQNDYIPLCKILDPRDLIISDGVFRNAIPKEKRRNTLICPWTKPRGEDLPSYKLRENKEISEQRGSFERHIGRLVNRFSILSKRFRHDTKYIREMILFIMSLHNLKEHPYLVLSPLINDHEEATSFITDNIDFLDEEIVEIQGSRFEQRTREEEEAYLNADSISNFLRNFEREISGSSADTNNLRIHRSNYDSSEEDNDYWPPNKRIRTEPSSDEEQE